MACACHGLASRALSRARPRRNLFAGFLIGRAQMVPWWSWYYYINPVAWSLCGPQQRLCKCLLAGQAGAPERPSLTQVVFSIACGFWGLVVAKASQALFELVCTSL